MKIKIEDHPTVKQLREKQEIEEGTGSSHPAGLEAGWLKQLARECGAADVGLVEIGRSELDDQREEILQRYSWTKTLLSFVCVMNRHSVRSVARSVANLEMHHRGEEVNEVSRRISDRFLKIGVKAVNPSMGFPMEQGLYPNRIWVIAHKPVAIAAGLGHMGIHRNVIHPKFGNHILLGTVLIDREATSYDKPVDYNPCLECNLCVAACPVGAISNEGAFNFSACFTHNYREFMGGYNDWVEQIADSKNALEYRKRMSETETASFWQSLSFGPNYKSAYCLAVCPAGEEVIPPFLDDRKGYLKDVVKPLQEKEETVYVLAGSDAEVHVGKRFKNKQTKQVGNALRTRSIRAFLDLLPMAFERNQSEGLDVTYHFTFIGDESQEATIVIRNKTLHIEEGLHGTPHLHVIADSRTWLGFLAKERNLVWSLVTRRIRLKGSLRWLRSFAKCFPTPSVQHISKEITPVLPLARPLIRPFLRNDPSTGRISSG